MELGESGLCPASHILQVTLPVDHVIRRLLPGTHIRVVACRATPTAIDHAGA